MTNIVATPVTFKSKTLFAALESTYDTAPTLLSANWVEARNLKLTPYSNSIVDRNIDFAGKGKMAGLSTIAFCKLTFDVGLAPSGVAGTAPKWGTLLLGAGFAETTVATTSVTYNLVSKNEKSLTLAYGDANDKHVITGARGTVQFKLDTNGVPMMSYEFTGHYVAPVLNSGGTALPTADKTGWAVEQLVDRRYTTGSLNTGSAVPVAFKSFMANMAQSIKSIEYPGPQSEVTIDDRAPTAEFQLLAPARSVLDPDALITNSTFVTATVVHGVGAGKVATLNTKGRFTAYDKVDLDGFLGYKMDLQLEATSATNDEFSLVLT